jgi:hypothetical protein
MKTAPAFRLKLICTIGDELRPLMSRPMTFLEAAQIRRHAQQPELVGIFPDTASCRRLARVMKPVAALLPMVCGGATSLEAWPVPIVHVGKPLAPAGRAPRPALRPPPWLDLLFAVTWVGFLGLGFWILSRLPKG